jgi:hypothetical protein
MVRAGVCLCLRAEALCLICRYLSSHTYRSEHVRQVAVHVEVRSGREEPYALVGAAAMIIADNLLRASSNVDSFTKLIF